MIMGLHYGIRLCICKYLYKELAVRHTGIVQSTQIKQPTQILSGAV